LRALRELIAQAWTTDALFGKVRAAGLANTEAVATMQKHVASGKFPLEYYVDMWAPKIAAAGRARDGAGAVEPEPEQEPEPEPPPPYRLFQARSVSGVGEIVGLAPVGWTQALKSAKVGHRVVLLPNGSDAGSERHPTEHGPLTAITEPVTIVYKGETTKGHGSMGHQKNRLHYEALLCFDPTKGQIRGPVSQYKGSAMQWADHMENDGGGEWDQATSELKCGVWFGSVDPESYVLSLFDNSNSSEMVFHPQTVPALPRR
jgi:hypothetical protein